MHHLRLIAQGRVQGVGYRYWVVREAERLGLGGRVRNLADGDVEIVAEGDRAALERLVDRAREGPPRAVVTHLAIEWGEGPQRHGSFTIDG